MTCLYNLWVVKCGSGNKKHMDREGGEEGEHGESQAMVVVVVPVVQRVGMGVRKRDSKGNSFSREYLQLIH